MHLELTRETSRNFPTVAKPTDVRSARVWHCKFATLTPLASLTNLETLVIATVPDNSLSFLEPLRKLRCLHIVHMPKVRDLSSIGLLENLINVSLATSPGWDASRKFQCVQSLEPLARLPRLKHLELFGVVPEDRNLDALRECRALVSARFSGYRKEDVAAFYELMAVTDDRAPQPEV